MCLRFQSSLVQIPAVSPGKWSAAPSKLLCVLAMTLSTQPGSLDPVACLLPSERTDKHVWKDDWIVCTFMSLCIICCQFLKVKQQRWWKLKHYSSIHTWRKNSFFLGNMFIQGSSFFTVISRSKISILMEKLGGVLGGWPGCASC